MLPNLLHDSPPPTTPKNYLTQNINSIEIEKPSSRRQEALVLVSILHLAQNVTLEKLFSLFELQFSHEQIKGVEF